MGDDDMIRRGDAKAAFTCETAYGRGVRAKLSDVPTASSRLVKRAEIQRNRDEAYQVGWDDGYAEGYGKALAAADARAEALKEAVNCECGAAINEKDAITCASGATLCHACAISNLHDALSLTTCRLEELLQSADLSVSDEGYEATIKNIIGENRTILRALDERGEGE